MIKTDDDNNRNFENDDHDEGASGASGDLFRVSDEDLWPGEATSSTSAGYDGKDDGNVDTKNMMMMMMMTMTMAMKKYTMMTMRVVVAGRVPGGPPLRLGGGGRPDRWSWP